MQQPPDISTALYGALNDQAQRLDVLLELYPNDTLPGADGFDPDDAILRVANRTRTFLGNAYTQRIQSIGTVNRTITEKFNTVSIDLDNPEEPPASKNRPVAGFILSNPIEGMFCVVRVVSRAFTPSSVSDSFVAFTGKCEKPFDSEGSTITISARQFIGSTEEEIPWRAFSPEDELGRLPTDPLFEGFLFSAKVGVVIYKERVRRNGFLGLLGFKKTVTRTLNFSNHQGAEIDKSVPLILGRAQVQFIPVAFIDAGGQINAIYNASEGPIKKFFDLRCITQGFQFASEADGNPDVDQFRFGYPGGTNGQVPFTDNLSGGIPGNGHYSMSAMMSTALYGTEVAQDDPAPEIIAVMMGMVISLPDSNGDFIFEDWSDNPAFQTRWMLTHPRVFNLNPAFINDPQCIKTACYCDDPVLDQTDGERILLPNSETANYGTLYRRYNSTGLFKPEYFLHYYLDVGQDPLPELTLPIAEFFDPTTAPTLTPQTRVRRRFTSNIYLSEKMKAPDFLHKVLLPTYRGFLTQTAKGKIDIKCRRPADNTLMRSASLAGADEVAVNSVLAWVADLSGEVIVGTNLLTSEIRVVTGTRYSSVANGITLAVSGGLSASGATLSGGDDDNPATGSVTVTGLGTLTVTIDGVDVSYTTVTADTTATAAAMLTQFLKANPTLQTYLKFTWTPTAPTVISIQSKLGFLELDSPLVNAHSVGQEVLRIQMSFSDTGADHANLAAANILKRTFRWPLGSQQSSVNRIDSTFIDSPQAFKSQPMRTRQQDHIDQTGKVLPEELTLTGVDSYSQAKRLQLSRLVELRDGDFFTQHTADRRAMLLEEGDLIANCHASGGFRNLPLRVEEVSLNLREMTVTITARRYLTSAYSDNAPARNVPLPTILTAGDAGPPAIAFNTVDFPPDGLIQTTASAGITSVRGGMIFGASVFGQQAKVSLKRPLETEFTQIDLKSPDTNNKAVFEFIASDEGTYTVQLEVCFTGAGGKCNLTKPTAQITITYGVLGALLTEAGGILLTESGDYLAME